MPSSRPDEARDFQSGVPDITVSARQTFGIESDFEVPAFSQGSEHVPDMLTYAKEAVSFADGRTRADLDTDSMFALALERAIEIIGEAAKNVSRSYQSAHPTIPWQDITRTRDLFAHAYFKIDPEILWSIVTKNLPELIGELETALEEK